MICGSVVRGSFLLPLKFLSDIDIVSDSLFQLVNTKGIFKEHNSTKKIILKYNYLKELQGCYSIGYPLLR